MCQHFPHPISIPLLIYLFLNCRKLLFDVEVYSRCSVQIEGQVTPVVWKLGRWNIDFDG